MTQRNVLMFVAGRIRSVRPALFPAAAAAGVGAPAVLAVLAAMGLAGCGPPPEKKLTNSDPSGMIPSIKQAARSHDRRAVPYLVKDLESDDPAVRFYAIEALRRITGQDCGYVYYEDEDAREPALKRWQQWLARRQGGDANAAGSGQP